MQQIIKYSGKQLNVFSQIKLRLIKNYLNSKKGSTKERKRKGNDRKNHLQ